MAHVVFRIQQKVSHHLRCLGMLNVNMLLLAHGLHEVLMDQLSNHLPSFSIVHDEKMIALGDQLSHI